MFYADDTSVTAKDHDKMRRVDYVMYKLMEGRGLKSTKKLIIKLVLFPKCNRQIESLQYC